MEHYFLMLSSLLLSHKNFSKDTAVQSDQISENYQKADMKYAAKKVEGKWAPATSDDIPVDSKFIMRVSFSNNMYDHD